MTCSRCGGFIYDRGDGLGLRCLMCGRSLEAPPTIAELVVQGVLYNEFHRREVEGKGSRGKEFEGFHLGVPLGRRHDERRARP